MAYALCIGTCEGSGTSEGSALAAALSGLLRRRAADVASVLVATHDTGFAAALADRRLVLRDGRLEHASPRPAVAA